MSGRGLGRRGVYEYLYFYSCGSGVASGIQYLFTNNPDARQPVGFGISAREVVSES